MEDGSDFAVSKTSGGELAMGDGFEHREVERVADAQRAEAAAVVYDRASHRVEQSRAGGAVINGSVGLKIALVGALGQFGATVEVRDALAHRSPSKRAVRVVANAKPPLRFELVGAYGGVDTVAIHYRSVGRKVVAENLELDDHRRVIRGCACPGADA